jgi:hypothetical protein
MDKNRDRFLAKLDSLPPGYSEGLYGGRRYGITLSSSPDGRRRWLFGEELGGPDRVSCNVYLLEGGRVALRPCEMPAAKVIDFVLELSTGRGGAAGSPAGGNEQDGQTAPATSPGSGQRTG